MNSENLHYIIMPIDYSEYPPNWFTELRPAVLERAGHRCEGSPKFPHCRASNYQPHPDTGSKVVLTMEGISLTINKKPAGDQVAKPSTMPGGFSKYY